jgi:triacylglycerol esterase/lipase EstA (alpha/beta hydrolase family)
MAWQLFNPNIVWFNHLQIIRVGLAVLFVRDDNDLSEQIVGGTLSSFVDAVLVPTPLNYLGQCGLLHGMSGVIVRHLPQQLVIVGVDVSDVSHDRKLSPTDKWDLIRSTHFVVSELKGRFDDLEQVVIRHIGE